MRPKISLLKPNLFFFQHKMRAIMSVTITYTSIQEKTCKVLRMTNYYILLQDIIIELISRDRDNSCSRSGHHIGGYPKAVKNDDRLAL